MGMDQAFRWLRNTMVASANKSSRVLVEQGVVYGRMIPKEFRPLNTSDVQSLQVQWDFFVGRRIAVRANDQFHNINTGDRYIVSNVLQFDNTTICTCAQSEPVTSAT